MSALDGYRRHLERYGPEGLVESAAHDLSGADLARLETLVREHKPRQRQQRRSRMVASRKESAMPTATAEPAVKEPTAEQEAETPAAEKAKPSGRATGKLSFHDAAIEVLRESGPMHVKDITNTVLERKLASTTGKTPVASMSSILLRGSGKDGHFIKVAPGTFDVRELNPRGAKKRPAAK